MGGGHSAKAFACGTKFVKLERAIQRLRYYYNCEKVSYGRLHFELLMNYTYEPFIVYSLVIVVMFLSSLGLPIPEEFSIISLGVLSYMGAHPEIYPPPYKDAPHVQMIPSMIVCAGSIL